MHSSTQVQFRYELAICKQPPSLPYGQDSQVVLLSAQDVDLGYLSALSLFSFRPDPNQERPSFVAPYNEANVRSGCVILINPKDEPITPRA